MIRFLFLLLLLFSFSAQAANLKDVGEDQFYPAVERSRGRAAAKILMIGAIATALTYSLKYDKPVRSNGDYHLGEALGAGGLSALLIGAQYFFDDDDLHYKSHLRGLIFTTATVFALKAVLKGRWPGANYEYQSFPSAQSAIAFMTATNLYESYGWPAAAIAYPVAAFVADSRLGYDCHRVSDVVVGATIGILFGRATFYESTKSKFENKITAKYQFIPFVDHDHIGTTVDYLF